MPLFRTTDCCGLREFSGLSIDPKADLIAFCDGWFVTNSRGNEHGAFAIFSDKVPSRGKSRAKKLAELIIENKLGTVQETAQKLNPSSGNQLVVYLFNPDTDKLKAWNETNNPTPNFKVGDLITIKPRSRTRIPQNNRFTGNVVYQGTWNCNSSNVRIQKLTNNLSGQHTYFPKSSLQFTKLVERVAV